jgi:hypothetical protein
MTTDAVSIEGLERANGETFKFEKVGDTIAGTITQVMDPFERENKFKPGQIDRVYAIGITPAGSDEQLMIWPSRTPRGSSPMLEAIVNAVTAAGAKAYVKGGKLAVRFDKTLDTGKGNPLKLYTAKYEPPAPSVSVGDDFAPF